MALAAFAKRSSATQNVRYVTYITRGRVPRRQKCKLIDLLGNTRE